MSWVENTPNELEAAKQEMVGRTANHSSLVPPDDDLQKRFKAIAKSCGLKHCSKPVQPFAPISRDFLERHINLLD